jgi:parallel beta-helix repeat protein
MSIPQLEPAMKQGTPDRPSSAVTADGYTPHELIYIDGNQDFLTQAESEGWPGTGTEEDPIIITRYSFASSDHLFSVLNSDIYFEFRDNILDGVAGEWCTTYFSHVRNGAIIDCKIWNGAIPFHMSNIRNCRITGNEAFDNTWEAIALEGNSDYNIIDNNFLHNNTKGGIILWDDSDYNQIRNNTISDNRQSAIQITTQNNWVTGNQIVANQGNGIRLYGDARSNVIKDNFILENSYDGITLNAEETSIEGNVISGNRHSGIDAYFEASRNSITNNSIINNTQYAITLGGLTSLNNVAKNDFIDNGVSSQALDNGVQNEFSLNYWSTWFLPDNDQNNIVDAPYHIDGSSNNTDPYPSASLCRAIPDWYQYSASMPTISTTTPTENSMDVPSFSFLDGFVFLGGVMLLATFTMILVRKRA